MLDIKYDCHIMHAAYEDTEILVTYTHDIADGAIQSMSNSAQEKAMF